MTINQLVYFIEVVKNKTLVQASKVLFVTQPTISMAIKNLETEFNIKLFDRDKNNLILTKQGEYLYNRALLIVDAFYNLEDNLKQFSNLHNKIKIGIPPMIGSFLFPKIYKDYTLKNPNIDFEMYEEGSMEIRKLINNNILDIGIVILNHLDLEIEEVFHKETILTTELLFCVSKEHRLAKKDVISIDDIKNKKILLMNEGSYQNKLINNYFGKYNFKPNISLISSQVTVINEFIKMNAGGAFLIKELAELIGSDIVGISMDEKMSLEIGLIWSKDYLLNEAEKKFINFLKGYKFNL